MPASTTKVGEDLASAEMLSLPITFAILLIAFGAFVAAGIPVLLAITSVITALGLYAPVSYLVPDAGQVANIVLLIGMAVGVDYSLFYLKREREERARGRSTIDAIEIAAATSGHAVIVSGLRGHGRDVGPVPVRRSGLQRARDRLHPGRAGRRDRLPDGAAGDAREVRTLRRSPPHPAAVAAEPAHRLRWDQRTPDPSGHPQAAGLGRHRRRSPGDTRRSGARHVDPAVDHRHAPPGHPGGAGVPAGAGQLPVRAAHDRRRPDHGGRAGHRRTRRHRGSIGRGGHRGRQ